MKEIWKDIEGYSGLYQVSDLGNVKALGNGNSNNSKERILKTNKNHKGYLLVGLSKQGKRKQHLVHRLVAMAFIDNPNNLEQINHRDECKTNNASSNLEWCTNEYNINYGTHNQRVAESNSKRVLCVETNKIYPSVKEATRQLGLSKGNISHCCNGRYKTAYGFHWKYVS